ASLVLSIREVYREAACHGQALIASAKIRIRPGRRGRVGEGASSKVYLVACPSRSLPRKRGRERCGTACRHRRERDIMFANVTLLLARESPPACSPRYEC